MEKLNLQAHRRLLWTAIGAMVLSLPCQLPAQSAGAKALLDRARSLASSGRLDMAVQTWKQVLLSDPNNTEALAGIARSDMQLGDSNEAQQYLNRLRAAGGSDAVVSQIEKMPRGASQPARIAEARRLAQSGQYEQAMEAYRAAFGNEPPAGNYALEYYDTEAAIPASRPHAIEGLRRLARQFPADSRYAVTLGRILTYEPRTRAEGIAMLQQYNTPEAQNALKRAMQWNAEGVAAAAAGPAGTVRRAGPPGNPLEGAAYRALNAGRLDEAERDFRQILEKQPNNNRALSGLGYVFMKRQDFAQAADYFQRAQSAGARGLDTALSTARFWQQMARASASLKAGDEDAAVEGYRAAVNMKPSDPDALEALAGALMRQGNFTEAATDFDRVAHAAPARASAWRGLFQAQTQAGDPTAALATNSRMPAAVRAQLNRDPFYLHALAQNQLALGQKDEADRTVKAALALPFPNQGRDLPADQQMEFASLLIMAQRYEPALQLYRQVVVEDPNNLDAWTALISAEHQLHHDDAAVAEFGKMPTGVYERAQKNSGLLMLVGSIYQSRHQWDLAQKYLEQALTLNETPKPAVELQLADLYAAEGSPQTAYVIYKRQLDASPDNLSAWRGILNVLHLLSQDREALRLISTMPESVRLRLEQDPVYIQSLASIQAATGQQQQALRTFASLIQSYASRNEPVPADVQIQYGWILLRANDDRRLYALVTNLSNTPNLTEEQQANFSNLWVAWSIRRANALLAAGDQRRSVAILEAAARAFPGNTDVYTALAGAYVQAGQSKKAVEVYSSLDMGHATAAEYRGAIGAALAAHDLKQAQFWLQSALDQYRDDASILKLAAEFEQERGDNGRAAAYYRAALAAMGPQSTTDIFTTPGNAAPDGVSPAQQLMDLLAPAGRPARVSNLSDPDATWQQAPAPPAVPTLGDYAGVPQSTPAESSYVDLPSANAAASDSDLLTGPSPEQVTVPVYRSQDRLQSSPQARPQAGPSGGSSLQDYADSPAGSEMPAHPLKDIADRNTQPVYPSQQRVQSSLEYVKPASIVMPSRPVAAMQEANGAAQSNNPAIRLESAVRELTAGPAPQQSEQYSGGSNMPENPQLQYHPQFQIDTQQPRHPWDLPSENPPAVAETRSLPPLTGPMVRAVQRQKTEREQMEDQLAAIEGSTSGWLGGTSAGSFRSGQQGYDRLSMYSALIEGSGVIGSNARLTIITQPVVLDSGQATGSETLLQGTLAPGVIPTSQSASGVGGEVQLRTPFFAGSIGYTPHAFLVDNIIGDIYIHPPSSHFTLTAGRDPVLDTQLSYAGLRDQGSAGPSYAGNIWGGITADYGELQIASGDSRWGWYLQGGGQHLTGVHVPDNSRYDGTAGSYWNVWGRPEYGNLTVGMNFFGMHYSRNLRFFTYGQGGYFSPNVYIVAGVPVSFLGHYGPRFHYRVGGSLGIQSFQEDKSPYYPLDLAVQTAQGNPYYPSLTDVGGNYSFDGEVAYAIADHWYVGGYLNANNSRDYASEKAGFFVRYLFRPQPTLEETGPTGLFPAQGLRPLQVP